MAPDLTDVLGDFPGRGVLQLLPGASEEMAEKLEQKIMEAPSVTAWLGEGLSPEDILQRLLGDFGLEITDKREVSFACDCSRERMESVLIGLGRHELLDLMLSQETVEVHCDYCNTNYSFTRPELKALFKTVFRSE